MLCLFTKWASSKDNYGTPPTNNNDQYSDEETQQRFLAAVKAGLNTKPKPIKSMNLEGSIGAIQETIETAY